MLRRALRKPSVNVLEIRTLQPCVLPMLTDPFVHDAVNYHRIGDGIYLRAGTSLDVPSMLTFSSTKNKSGSAINSILIKESWATNSVTPGLPDDRLDAYVVFRHTQSLGFYTNASLKARLTALNATVTEALLERLNRGEV